jgi:type I restriction enzyme S subunit
MSSEWRECSIGDLVNVKHGFAFSGEHITKDHGKCVLVTPGNFEIGGGFKEGNAKYFHGLYPEEFVFAPGDLIVTMTDLSKTADTLGYSAKIPRVGNKIYLHNQRIGKVIAKSSNANLDFLYWVMRHKDYRNLVVSTATGSTVRHTSPSRILAYSFLLPPPSQQQAIAHILGTLDDKIELNRKTNETLEAMAKALFKSWFVDFDPVRAKTEGRPTGLPAEISDLFPDSFEDSELGEIPSGWRDGEIQDVADLNPENWGSRNQPIKIRYLDLASVKYGRTDNLEEYEWEDAPSRARRILKKGDTVVGTVRPGNGSYCLIGEDGITGSTGFAVLRPKARVDDAFVYLGSCSKDNIDRLAHLADGGAYPAVRPELVAQTPVVIPSRQVLDHFSSYVSPLFANAGERERESKVLCHLRDTLLPKLISGELRISDAEQLVGNI